MSKLSDTQKTYYESASRVYAGQFAKSSGSQSHASASGYLAEHGVTGVMARKYRLGLVADPLDGDERFRNAISIPYLGKGGVAAIRFRMFDGEAKMAVHKGQANRLYNTAAYFKADQVIGLAEGEIDALVATEVFGIPTLGVPGAKNWKDIWTPLLKDFTRVLIFADGDHAGKEAAELLAEHASWRARVIQCPPGEDVASMAASQPEVLARLISTSNPDSE